MPFPPELAPAAPAGYPASSRLGSPTAYAAAVIVTVVAVLSQYVVPGAIPGLRPLYGSLLGGLAIVYGVPVLAFAVLVGGLPLSRWRENSAVAAWEGLRWYGLLFLVGFGVLLVLVPIYERFDPSALDLLNRPNPVLAEARSNPWFWVAFSFVIGAVEESIFRGWVFGYWLARGTERWWSAAVGSSVLFAAVHVYYGSTYGAAAPLIYPTLFLLGLGLAIAVRNSGGNLWVAALLHGAHDSAAFLLLLSPYAAYSAEYGLIVLGLGVALVDYLARSGRTPPAPGWAAGSPPGSGGAPGGGGPSPPPPPSSSGPGLAPTCRSRTRSFGPGSSGPGPSPWWASRTSRSGTPTRSPGT